MKYIQPCCLRKKYTATPTIHTSVLKYQMGWFNNDDSNNSGVSIDWDTYEQINGLSEDRGIIEVPADSETVIYESPDGDVYEIPVSDLIDADDDNEITYNSTGRYTISHHKRTRNKTSNMFQYPVTFWNCQQFARTR